MDWNDDLLSRLSATIPCGYHALGQPASEPTALAALALLARGRIDTARVALNWLAQMQSDDGSIGISAANPDPKWPTSLAVLAWVCASQIMPAEFDDECRRPIQDALGWIIEARGHTAPRDFATGHDTTIPGWPWVDGTHSWLEPTCFHVLALKATGRGRHSRAKEAVCMVHDRLLSTGGCNYGNTVVLGQELRPHLQPTGIAMTALAGQNDADHRIKRSLNYLAAKLPSATGTASLAWAVIGLVAHGRATVGRDELLQRAYERTLQRGASPFRLAMLALAALGDECPLIRLAATSTTNLIAT